MDKDTEELTDDHSALTVEDIVSFLRSHDVQDAVPFLEDLVEETNVEIIVEALQTLSPEISSGLLASIQPQTRVTISRALAPRLRKQWHLLETFPEGSVGRLIDPTAAVFSPSDTVGDTIEVLRDLVHKEFVTYAFVVGDSSELLGVIVMRELMFAERNQCLSEIMIADPFFLSASDPVMEALQKVITRHFPVYPVTDENGAFLGVVRGHRLFSAQAVEISAQAGAMVGVEKQDRLTTPWRRSLRYRQPWLQLNVFTAFIAGGVVSVYQNTIDHYVILAVFLPILAGQAGNTGSQALAVTVRALTLDHFKNKNVFLHFRKEFFLGMVNGALVGLTAGCAMYILARGNLREEALQLSTIVFFAMTISCAWSALSGAVLPFILRKIGTDPATAASIFLSTLSDVVSMGSMLALAALWFGL